jgi:hypothetical protein
MGQDTGNLLVSWDSSGRKELTELPTSIKNSSVITMDSGIEARWTRPEEERD